MSERDIVAIDDPRTGDTRTANPDDCCSVEDCDRDAYREHLAVFPDGERDTIHLCRKHDAATNLEFSMDEYEFWIKEPK